MPTLGRAGSSTVTPERVVTGQVPVARTPTQIAERRADLDAHMADLQRLGKRAAKTLEVLQGEFERMRDEDYDEPARREFDRRRARLHAAAWDAAMCAYKALTAYLGLPTHAREEAVARWGVFVDGRGRYMFYGRYWPAREIRAFDEALPAWAGGEKKRGRTWGE